jgi:acetyl esterase/lipase
MIKPADISFEEFPEDQENSPGMKTLAACPDEWFLQYEHDVLYVTRDGLDLHLQVLRPVCADQRSRKFPCVLYIQGSGWMKQNVYFKLPVLAKLAQRGFVVAVIEHRPSAVAPFPAQLIDSKTAIRFMRKHAAEYNADPENIFISGESSGGHTALLVGVTEGLAALDSAEYGEFSAHVNAVIDFFGPTDITKMNDVPSIMDHIGPESPEGMLIGGKNVLENLDLAKKTNPINYVSKEHATAPILIMHGSKDRKVHFSQSVMLFEALKAAGKTVEFYKVSGADHGAPQFWTGQVLDIVEAFIRRYVQI